MHVMPKIERNVEYGFPAAGAQVKFAALDGCNYLDILEYKNEANVSYCIQDDGDLRGEGLGAWLDRVEIDIERSPEREGPSNSSGRVLLGGLRLLYGACNFDSATSCPVLPLTESTFQILQNKLGLPERFLNIIIGSGACAFKSSCAQRQRGPRFCPSTCKSRSLSYLILTNTDFKPGFVFRIGIYRPNYYQLALSYDSQSRLTYGILLAKTKDHEFPRLISMLKQREKECIQPLLLANLLMELAIDSAGKRIQAADWRLNELEEMMGQHEYVNRPKGDPLKMDFIATTRTLNTTSRILGVESMRLGASILALELISRETKELQLDFSIGTGCDERNQDGKCSRRVTDLTAYQMNACQNLVLRAEYEEKRVQSQIAVVYQFMAQKDSKVNISLAETSATIAHESKKDSSSMKAIAVLTMCFLPGTFLAAIFAMPLFNWDDNTLPVVKDGFKYYWAIAIPLTILVLVLWALAMLLPWGLWLSYVRVRGENGGHNET